MDALSYGAYRNQPPDLEPHHGWINAAQALSWADLRGKVVLIEFWSSGGINSYHALADIDRLAAKHADYLVVIGVHSPKFPIEGDPNHLARAVQKLGLHYPVVNDRDLGIFRAYGIRAWPTAVLVDPEGFVAAVVAGEGNAAQLESAVIQLAEEARSQGALREIPLPRAEACTEEGLLCFPGKVLASSDRIYISDTAHHRVLVTDLDGKIQAVAGCGKPGWEDGGFARARFHSPNGLVLIGSSVFLADTRNHLIRRLDFATQRVETVAGTGTAARNFSIEGSARRTALRSPWDLATANGSLYIAMAGSHQVWLMDPAADTMRAFAGTGNAGLSDGPLLEASFNQPTGLTTDGERLYICDADSSAIRRADLESDGWVVTVVGSGGRFGDEDGTGETVRLQHSQGLAWARGRSLYVADTYNDKIKRLDAAEGQVETLRFQDLDGGSNPRTFWEPGGLSFLPSRRMGGDQLFVADTNHHRIRIANLQRLTVSTLRVREA